MELRAAYLNHKANWMRFAPRTARENRLLVLQGGASELAFYREQGWHATVLAFAVGLSGGFENAADCIVESPWNDSWSVDGIKFDAMVCNQAGNHLLSESLVVRHLMALLLPKGELRVRLRNPVYYGDVLIRSGREVWPQPHDFPHGYHKNLEDLQADLSEMGCSLTVLQEDLDGMYHSSEMPQWPSINAWDCSLFLPDDPVARKQYFVQSWLLSLQPVPVARELANEIDGEDLESLHKEIGGLLDGVHLEEAGLVLDKLFQSGRADADTCNLQGVLHFYRKNFPAAWESFRMAILLKAERLDYYQNLTDAAIPADRVSETKDILMRAQGKVAGIEGLHFDA